MRTFSELLKDYKARYLGVGKVDPKFYIFYEDGPKIFAQEKAIRAELREIDANAHKGIN